MLLSVGAIISPGVVAIKTLILIVLIAIGLRVVGLTFDSLWLDEGYQTVVESYGNDLPDLTNSKAAEFLFNPGIPAGLHQVLSNFRNVDPLCPPLFAVLMNRWLTIFGGSDLAIRSFAAVISVLSVVVLYFLGCALFGRRVAAFAALMQAMSPFDIAYAQEARMYALVVLLATVSCGSFVLMLCSRQSVKTAFLAIAYILSTWALVNTHYTGLFIWAFQLSIGFLLTFVRKDWLSLAWLAASNLAIAIICLPWYPLFCEAAAIRTASFYVARSSSMWWPIWALIIKIPSNWVYFLAGKHVMSWASPIYPVAVAILFLGFKSLCSQFDKLIRELLAHSEAQRQTNDSATLDIEMAVRDRVDRAFLLLCWCLLPALFVWLVDTIESHRVIEIPRYVIGTEPAIMLIAGMGIASALKKGKFGWALVVGYAIFALANTTYAHIVLQREDWRGTAALVSKVCKPEEPLFVSQYYDIVCLDRYLNRPVRQIGVSSSIGKENLIQLLNNNACASGTLWVLTAQEGDGVFAMIPDSYQVIDQYDLHHALHLRHYLRMR
jgi:hypothetical protein